MSTQSSMTSSMPLTSTQMGGKRKLSKWNKFVSKVYAEQHKKNKNFQFKDALKMASAMKKKGHYGGATEPSAMDVDPLPSSAMDVDPLSDDMLGVVGKQMANAEFGGRRRRRTMRRSRSRSRGRTMRRSRARASRRR
jgi:hypothetical protein